MIGFLEISSPFASFDVFQERLNMRLNRFVYRLQYRLHARVRIMLRSGSSDAPLPLAHVGKWLYGTLISIHLEDDLN
jgi:hypothetical protein